MVSFSKKFSSTRTEVSTDEYLQAQAQVLNEVQQIPERFPGVPRYARIEENSVETLTEAVSNNSNNFEGNVQVGDNFIQQGINFFRETGANIRLTGDNTNAEEHVNVLVQFLNDTFTRPAGVDQILAQLNEQAVPHFFDTTNMLMTLMARGSERLTHAATANVNLRQAIQEAVLFQQQRVRMNIGPLVFDPHLQRVD